MSTLPKIVLFGDSLTQYSFYGDDGDGLGQVLQKHYKGRAEVTNEGFAGYTTELVKPQFTRLANALRADPAPPLLVTVWFGANDGTISSVHVPLERFKANLRAFVATLLDAVGAPRVLLITPPPINVHRHGSRASAARGAASGAAAGGSGGGGPAKDTDVAAAAADGGSGPADGDAPDDDARDAAAVRAARRELGPRVYARKMAYAAAVLDVVGELADPRVAACDVWRAVVLHGLASSKRGTLPAAELCVDRPWEAMVRWRLPGSGLPLAEEFAEGVFTDGLHFGALGYQVVTMAVFDAILEHWPEML